jgi:hypothetical protein
MLQRRRRETDPKARFEIGGSVVQRAISGMKLNRCGDEFFGNHLPRGIAVLACIAPLHS